MDILPKEKWLRILVICAYVLVIGAVVYLFLGKAVSVLAPFLAAFLLGWMLKHPAQKLHRRTGIPRKILSSVLVVTLISFIGFVIFLLANQLIAEAQRLFEGLSQNSGGILSFAASTLDGLGKKFPFIYDYLDRDVVNGTVTEVLKNLIASLSAYLATLLRSVVTGLPDICLSFVVFVIASFYFAIDPEGICRSVKKALPKKWSKRLSDLAKGLKSCLCCYLKAYAVILLITFALLFVGFLILGVSYATTLAIIIALLDMLPVIGTGTVLIPWAVISFTAGDIPRGIGLIILFGIITVTREVTEPRIIGRSIGMHPLLTLGAMYAGYSIFGLWGILALPVTVNLAKALFINYTPKDSI